MKWSSITTIAAIATGLVTGADGLCSGTSTSPMCAAASACNDMCDGNLKCSDMVNAYGCAQVTTFSNCPSCTCSCPPGAPPAPVVPTRTGSCTGSSKCSTSLEQWQIDSLLDIHNTFRAYHGACPLTYDTAIASYALGSSGFQQTCNSGSLSHNNPPQYSGGRLGENIAMSGGTKDVHNFDPANGVMNWYCDEEPCWNYATASESDTTGHFTQVVWKESTKVGCALCHIGSGNSINVYLMCNYEAAGNSANSQGVGTVYETNVGSPSSSASCGNPPPTAPPTVAPGSPPTATPTGVPGVPPTAAPTAPPGTPPTGAPGVPPTVAPTGTPGVPPTASPNGPPLSSPSTPSPDDEGTPAWVWVAIVCGILLLIGCGIILYMLNLLHSANKKDAPLLRDISDDLPRDEVANNMSEGGRREMQVRDTTVRI